MNVTKLYVVRHGESEYNRDNIVSGHVDPPLTELGKQQARLTRDKLSATAFDVAYSSDLQRAVDTGTIVFGAPIPKTHQLPALRERFFGDFEGRPNAEYQASLAAKQVVFDQLSEADKWKHKNTPNIESDHELSERFVTALAEIAQGSVGKTVLVAAHGGTVRTMLIKLGYVTRPQLQAGSISNAAYVELDYLNGEFSVIDHDGITIG